MFIRRRSLSEIYTNNSILGKAPPPPTAACLKKKAKQCLIARSSLEHPKLLRAVPPRDCQTWYTKGQNNGARAFKVFVPIYAMWGERSVATLTAVFAQTKKLLSRRSLYTTDWSSASRASVSVARFLQYPRSHKS